MILDRCEAGGMGEGGRGVWCFSNTSCSVILTVVNGGGCHGNGGVLNVKNNLQD